MNVFSHMNAHEYTRAGYKALSQNTANLIKLGLHQYMEKNMDFRI